MKHSKFRTCKHLSDSFLLQNGQKQGDALSSLLFNVALGYTVRNFQDSQVGLKLNGTYQLLAYAVDMNLPRDNIDTIKKKTVKFNNTAANQLLPFSLIIGLLPSYRFAFVYMNKVQIVARRYF
jgi:riboflavin transporter FmnP